MSNQKNNDITNIRLIQLVEKHSCLYEKKAKNKDKNIAWSKVSKMMKELGHKDMDEKACSKRWSYLREQFTRAHRKVLENHEIEITFKHFKQMSFIENHISHTTELKAQENLTENCPRKIFHNDQSSIENEMLTEENTEKLLPTEDDNSLFRSEILQFPENLELQDSLETMFAKLNKTVNSNPENEDFEIAQLEFLQPCLSASATSKDSNALELDNIIVENATASKTKKFQISEMPLKKIIEENEKKKQELENFEPQPSGSNVKNNSTSLIEINNFLSKYLNPLERKTAESIRWRIPVITSEENKENLESGSLLLSSTSAVCDNTKVVSKDTRIFGKPKIVSNVVVKKALEKQNEIPPIDIDTDDRDFDLNEELAKFTATVSENSTAVSGGKVIQKKEKKNARNVNTLKNFPLRPPSTKQFEESNFKKEIDLSHKNKRGIHPPLDIYAKRLKNNDKDQEPMRKAVDCFQELTAVVSSYYNKKTDTAQVINCHCNCNSENLDGYEQKVVEALRKIPENRKRSWFRRIMNLLDEFEMEIDINNESAGQR